METNPPQIGLVSGNRPSAVESRINLQNVPIVTDIEIPPRSETRYVEEPVFEDEVKTIKVPHLEVREEIETVPVTVHKQRFVNKPKIEVLHRKIEIPKPVKQQRIVEMPQLHVVDNIVEKEEFIYKEKIVEQPKYIIQERIIPVPKRKVEEVTVRIPRSQFDKVIQAEMEDMKFEREKYSAMVPPEPEYENLGGPMYRHLPKPVDLPMVHYKPVPVEREVDRNVPVPVELNITREYQCPLLVPNWTETAVPVHVSRVIEKPVPADTMTNKVLLGMYMDQTEDVDRWVAEKANSWFGSSGKDLLPTKEKMSDSQIKARQKFEDTPFENVRWPHGELQRFNLLRVTHSAALMRVVIVGSGPCGLGAGLEFKQLGHKSWHIYEQSDCYGGLSASVTENGYTWDYGGHVLFSHYGYYDDVLKILGPSCNHLKRSAVVFMHDGSIVDYPIQMSVAQMKPEAARRVMHGLLDVRLNQHFRVPQDLRLDQHFGVPQSILNFEDWSISKMGLGIHEMFMKPYNEKLWSTQMNQMGFEWVGERVAVPDIQELLEMKTDLTWGPNRTFLYPKTGGVGAIWNEVALNGVGKQNITLNSKLTLLDPIEKTVIVGSETVEYDRLISTIPLADLISSLKHEQIPQFAELSAAVESLRYNAVLIVGLGISGAEPNKIQGFHWAYVPDSAVPFYRVTVLSHYSESMAPAGQYSLMLECSLAEEKFEFSDMLNRCCQACSDLGLLDITMIVHKWVKIIPKAYPIPTIDRDSQLEGIHNILEQYDIFSRGRFGGWKYEVANMDHCMMQGVEIARRICNDKKEITYPSPNFVNNPKNRSAIDLDFRFLCELPV